LALRNILETLRCIIIAKIKAIKEIARERKGAKKTTKFQSINIIMYYTLIMVLFKMILWKKKKKENIFRLCRYHSS